MSTLFAQAHYPRIWEAVPHGGDKAIRNVTRIFPRIQHPHTNHKMTEEAHPTYLSPSELGTKD